MSGIAEVFLNQGYPISGSDLTESDNTRRLKKLGASICIGHSKENLPGASVVVISSAVKPNNPEVIEAKRLRIPVIPRAEMLGELMRGKTGIAVAGSHGKTTTTSMLATVLTHAGLDPTLVIGGIVDLLGGNAKLGQGQFVVAEADESDGSFLHLPASYGIITNIDNDHLDHYGSLMNIENAFVDFVGKFPFYGLVSVCAEDEGVRRCLERFTKPVTTYGFSKEWEFWAQEIELKPFGTRFLTPQGWVELKIPGKHNVLNALSTIPIALKFGIPFPKIAEGLEMFQGVDRRFQIRFQDEKRKTVVIDDYGHHPTEISATLDTARNFWKGRIITVFQPHRFSRTLQCHDGFLKAFLKTDVLILSDIYPAGEEPIAEVHSEILSKEIQKFSTPYQKIIYGGNLDMSMELVLKEFQDGDLILFLGAGSITKLAGQFIKTLGARSK